MYALSLSRQQLDDAALLHAGIRSFARIPIPRVNNSNKCRPCIVSCDGADNCEGWRTAAYYDVLRVRNASMNSTRNCPNYGACIRTYTYLRVYAQSLSDRRGHTRSILHGASEL